VLLPLDRLARVNGGRSAPSAGAAMSLRVSDLAVRISPPDIVKTPDAAWRGMRAEIVQVTSRERIEYRYCGPLHLLVVCEQGIARTARHSSRVCRDLRSAISAGSSPSCRPATNTTNGMSRGS